MQQAGDASVLRRGLTIYLNRVKRFFFEIWEGLVIALRAVAVNKMRSVLTTLGIIIGIISVTGMATVVNGIEKGFEQDMASLGTDVVYIEKWPWSRGPGFKWWNYINRPNIKADLAVALEDRSRFVAAATAVVRTSRTVKNGSRSVSGVVITGASPNFTRVHQVDIGTGFFYSDLDDMAARNVAVIGSGVAEELFPVSNPMGKEIRISGNKFRVIGILEKKGQGADGPSSSDTSVQIPFNTFKSIYGVRWRNISVQAKLIPEVSLAEAKDEIRGVARIVRHLDAREEDDFELNEQQTLRETIAPIKAAIYSIGDRTDGPLHSWLEALES